MVCEQWERTGFDAVSLLASFLYSSYTFIDSEMERVQ